MTATSEARPPAYGVRVTVDVDKVTVRALDSSGRGLPVGVLLVPVEQQGERFRMAEPGGGLEFCSLEQPKREHQIAREFSKKKPASEEDMVTLYPFEVSRAKWPLGPQILVLLLYDQSEGVGGSPRPPSLTRGDASHLALVREALTYDSADELR